MGRVGASFSHGSGDYGIAFSTGSGAAIAESAIDPYFIAVQDAVEEALLNSLVSADTTVGFRGRVRHAISHDELTRLLS
jgi:D-aminopeptidase